MGLLLDQVISFIIGGYPVDTHEIVVVPILINIQLELGMEYFLDGGGSLSKVFLMAKLHLLLKIKYSEVYLFK